MTIESVDDRIDIITDSDSFGVALFAEVPDALDDDGNTTVIVERNAPCIFDKSYIEQGGREAFFPTALVLDEDAAYIDHKHRLMLLGFVYEVNEIRPDGTGFTLFILKLLGGYLLSSDDPAVTGGYATGYGLNKYGAGTVTLNTAPNADPASPRLAYPYTVSTLFDWRSPRTRL